MEKVTLVFSTRPTASNSFLSSSSVTFSGSPPTNTCLSLYVKPPCCIMNWFLVPPLATPAEHAAAPENGGILATGNVLILCRLPPLMLMEALCPACVP